MTTPPPNVLLQLDRADLNFGRTRALRSISLKVQRGDRLMLVGANGSGKTTLLRVLHGVLCPSAPTQRLVLQLQPEGRVPKMAMVFQRPFLLSLSVRRNLLVGLWLQGVPAAQREGRCHAALQRMGLSTLADRPARTLSGGQQQRLALARAWALQPDILFLDEPTASLDPGAKREVEALIQTFADQGVTLVMSTHNLGQAQRLGTHVAYLEAGELLDFCPVDEFFSSPDLSQQARHFLKGELPWQT